MTGLRPGADPVSAAGGLPRKGGAGAALLVLLAAGTGWASHVVLTRFGPVGFLVVMALVLGLAVYAIVSFRALAVPFFVWFVVTGGFRFLWAIEAPVLPDMTLDRITMIWLTAVVMVKFVAERRGLRNFGKLDTIIIAHCTYVLVRVILDDMVFFRVWSMSILIPYAAFFFAKNIITTARSVQFLLVVILVLNIYYNITSVAEKLDLDWLLWPSYMREPVSEFRGRSSGPFRQAPLFGTIIGMMLPLHFYFFAKTRVVLFKILLFLSLSIGLAGLYFTYTRGSWLAGFMALAVAASLNRRRYLPLAASSLLIGAIVAVTVLGIGQDKFMRKRVEEQNTVETRIGIAVTAFRAWKSDPIFGVGFFRYRSVREEFMAPTTLPVYGTVRLRQVRGISLHDMYLGPLAEEGLVGFGMQMSIYALVFTGLFRRLRRSDPDDEFARLVLPVFAGIYVGYLVGGLAIDYRYFSFVGALFFVAAGVQGGYDPARQSETAGVAVQRS